MVCVDSLPSLATQGPQTAEPHDEFYIVHVMKEHVQNDVCYMQDKELSIH